MRYDFAILIQTIEHVGDPAAVLRAIRRVLRPGGRVLVVTDNTGSLDFTIAKRRHWGGYHFPRHWYLFDADSLRRLATHTGFSVDELDTMVSPVNWVYSLRNALDDWAAPRPVVDWLSLESPIPLAAFTAFDWLHQRAGRGCAPARGAAAHRRASVLSTPLPRDHQRTGRRRGWGDRGPRPRPASSSATGSTSCCTKPVAPSAAWPTRIATRTASRSTPARTSSPTASRPRPRVADQCRDVERYGETVWLDGRSHDYPTGLLRVPRFLRLGSARARPAPRSDAPVSAADWFRREYGAALADEIAGTARRGVVRCTRRASSPRPSPTRSPGSIAATIGLTLAARLTHRAVAIGYCREAPQSANVWHVYPEHGVATVCERLAADVADSVRLRSPVERINVSDGRAVGVRVAGRDVPAAAVISTAPINVLPRMVEGTDALEPFAPVPLPARWSS